MEAHPQANGINVDDGDDADVLPTSNQFWDHWPFSPEDDSPECTGRFVVTKKDVSKSLNFAEQSLTVTAYNELAQPDSPCHGSAALSVLTEDLVSSRVGALNMKLNDYCSGSSRVHTVRNVLRLALWLAEKSGSSLSTFMDRLKHGLAYLRFVERFVGDRASQQELRGTLAPVEVASATFLAHVLKCLGCVHHVGQDGGKPVFSAPWPERCREEHDGNEGTAGRDRYVSRSRVGAELRPKR